VGGVHARAGVDLGKRLLSRAFWHRVAHWVFRPVPSTSRARAPGAAARPRARPRGRGLGRAARGRARERRAPRGRRGRGARGEKNRKNKLRQMGRGGSRGPRPRDTLVHNENRNRAALSENTDVERGPNKSTRHRPHLQDVVTPREPFRKPYGPCRARPAHLLYLARWSSIPPMSGLFFLASTLAKWPAGCARSLSMYLSSLGFCARRIIITR